MQQNKLRQMSEAEHAHWSKYYGIKPIDLGSVNFPRTIFTLAELDALTLAVYGGITLFQLPGSQKYEHQSVIRTRAISVDLLCTSLGLDSRKKVAVRQALQKMVTAQIIAVTPIEPAMDWLQGWFCCQLPINFDGVGYLQGFSRINIIDWERIKLRLIKPADKIKGYAAYLAVQQNIYHHTDAFRVCYQSQSALGATYGRSCYSVARTLRQLEANGVLAINKVLWVHRRELLERNIISCAQDYEQLATFIHAQYINGNYAAILA